MSTGRPAAPLRDEMTELEGTFVAALEAGDPRAAVGALLDLDSAISARVRAGEDSPDLDNASATFRSLIVRLGDRAAAGSSDGIGRDQLDPLVGALLAARDQARAARDWAAADLIRDRLAAAGIEVRDSAEGSTWVMAGDDDVAALRRGSRRLEPCRVSIRVARPFVVVMSGCQTVLAARRHRRTQRRQRRV